MGVEALQVFLESGHIEGSVVSTDLVRIAKNAVPSNAAKSKQNQRKLPPMPGKLSLVLDAECCLNRLYGGYFSDWVCGGQWNRAATFLSQFINSLTMNNIELVVFFNGCFEQARHHDWIQNQLRQRKNINQVLRHVNHKGTPPPKIWWTAPNCLRSVLRMALRNLNIPIVVSMDDHRQEVIAYCRENQFDGIVADDAEYIAFDPPRYFSAQSVKLTYKGSLDTKEYIISELAKGLGLNGDQMCVLVALLGNYMLPESELADLHRKLSSGPTKKESSNSENKEVDNCAHLVKSVADFVKSLTHTARQLDKLGLEVFGTAGTERAAKLKQAVQYYLNGTQTDFFNYRLTNQSGGKGKHKKIVKPGDKTEIQEPNMDTSRLASESVNELESLISLTEAHACLTVGPDSEHDIKDDSKSITSDKVNGEVSGNGVLVINAGSSSSSGSPRLDSSNSTSNSKSNKPQKQVRLIVEDEKISPLPPVPQEVLRTVNERHTKGLMSPMIYQILTQGEIRLGVVMEDESHDEVPNIQLFYRPMRQMVYAILFNLHHHIYLARNQSKENKGGDNKVPEVKIKEWLWSKNNPYLRPDTVRAEQLGWGVPTVQRLWFGTTVDDKRRRLRAYLTCMRSDTQLMLDSSYVPQHLLVLATVLRYIMSMTDKRVLRKYELDAVIATALDPHLANSEFNQELKLECVTARSVQVGSLIMAGIEHALLVNDTCGAPIPWVVACPWLYFDGKLLHSTMARAANVKNALELCSHRLPQVMKVERMREAVLEGLYVQWARPHVPSPLSSAGREDLNVGKGYERVALSPSRYCICENGHVVPSGGGRLEIAGVVVGNWGANCRVPHNQSVLPPQVTSVGVGGGAGRGRGFNMRNQSNNHRNNRQSNRNQNKNNSGSGSKKGSSGSSKSGKRNRGQGGSSASNSITSRGIGRGTTAVSPFTGEVVDAHTLVTNTIDSRLDDCITQQQPKQQRHYNKDKSSNNKQQSMRILNHQNNQSALVNGKDTSEQFADADTVTADLKKLKMNGTEEDGSSVKTSATSN